MAVPISDLLLSDWDWDTNRLNYYIDAGDQHPLIPCAFLEVSLSRIELVEWLSHATGLPELGASRRIGRPPKYDPQLLVAFLDELDEPRGTKSNHQLANELVDRFTESGRDAPHERHALRIVQKLRPATQ